MSLRQQNSGPQTPPKTSTIFADVYTTFMFPVALFLLLSSIFGDGKESGDTNTAGIGGQQKAGIVSDSEGKRK